MTRLKKSNHAVAVEDIQDMVERGIMEMRGYEVAQKYVRYRYTRELARKANTTDDGILSFLLIRLMKKLNRKIPTRILQLTPPREIIWQVKSARI